MRFYLVLILFLGLVQAKSDSPSILILNEYHGKVVDASISNHFPSKNFVNSEDTSPFLGSLDSLVNPASGRMSLIRELGSDFDVDYVLFHQIESDSNRFMLEGQMFNTKSGGLIKRRIVDVTSYYKGQVNELKLWVGDVFREVNKEWVDQRKLILYNEPSEIIQDKTPEGAMARSLLLPGWGQFYSDAYNSGVAISSLESVLLTSVLVSYLSYNKSVKNFKNYSKLYEESSEQVEFDEYRSLSNTEWEKHKQYNSALIYTSIASGSLWLVNGIHAYIVGPRPKKDIIQKWNVKIPPAN
jgi:hypothetical protein|tara:strand:+ start:3171 stop:4064 length:894 start_codon:yes stop_codon:yes gene_type:complete